MCIPDLVIIKYLGNNAIEIKRIVFTYPDLLPSADGSKSGYVKTILLISIVLFPKYFIITKSGIHTIVLTDFVYCIFRYSFNIK